MVEEVFICWASIMCLWCFASSGSLQNGSSLFRGAPYGHIVRSWWSWHDGLGLKELLAVFEGTLACVPALVRQLKSNSSSGFKAGWQWKTERHWDWCFSQTIWHAVIHFCTLIVHFISWALLSKYKKCMLKNRLLSLVSVPHLPCLKCLGIIGTSGKV